ncbi:MAG: ABC transporter substrate-binding protein, partial [Nitriliruptorales bacterium]
GRGTPNEGGQPAREPAEERRAGPPEAPLYDDEEKYQGITDDRIHLCGHAALVFAEAFDTRPEDLNVYWEWVNDNGGIHGRRVTMSWKDDSYSPDQAVQAAQSCKSENPFMLIGGIGFDQIPSVRTWAEQNRMLYLHHIAVAPDRTYNFSYSAQPTVDETGRAFGEYIASRHGDKPVGIIWRQSEFWEPGHRRGREVLDAEGVDVRADLPVQRNQSLYSQEIAELQAQGAEVVWIWENALAAAQIIQQARQQGYTPKWIVFPFQTTLDVVGDAALDPTTIEGVASWSAYVPGGYGGAFAEHGYDEEIKRFEEVFARYRSRGRTNDILWQVWVGNKWLHDLLEKCGRDCNRNRIAGMFLSGYKTLVEPSCVADFAHANSFGGHIGGHEFYTLETFRTDSGGPGFETTGWCSAHLN